MGDLLAASKNCSCFDVFFNNGSMFSERFQAHTGEQTYNIESKDHSIKNYNGYEDKQ